MENNTNNKICARGIEGKEQVCIWAKPLKTQTIHFPILMLPFYTSLVKSTHDKSQDSTRLSSSSSHSHVSQFASSRSQISPSTYLYYFFCVRSLFLTAHNKTTHYFWAPKLPRSCNTMLLLMFYSPVAGAVARLALLVTVSPSTLSSFTWFLFISFSSFFLLRVRSLLTCGAPLLVTCWPLSPWSAENRPGGPRSDSILGHILGPAAEKFSSLRGEKILRESELVNVKSLCVSKVTDSDRLTDLSLFHLAYFAQSKGRAKIVRKTKSLIWK